MKADDDLIKRRVAKMKNRGWTVSEKELTFAPISAESYKMHIPDSDSVFQEYNAKLLAGTGCNIKNMWKIGNDRLDTMYRAHKEIIGAETNGGINERVIAI